MGITVSFVYFLVPFFTGLSYGWRDLACPAMQSMQKTV
jgi:hypothetical protein